MDLLAVYTHVKGEYCLKNLSTFNYLPLEQ